MLWRVLAPRWAHAPLSGEGAAITGGRFNAAGQPALYLSETLQTAADEYEQAAFVRPGTFCAYVIRGGRIADLIGKPSLAAGADIAENWREAKQRGEQPGTWALANALRTKGFHGLRAPSVRHRGGVNWVLWSWNARGAPVLIALDPNEDLPLDQSSWEKKPRKARR